MEKIETLDFDGRTLFFTRKWHSGSVHDYYTTVFYVELKTKMVRKYILFGPLIEVPNYEVAFEIDCDINNPHYTKGDIRLKIQEKLNIYDREIEIKNKKYI